MIEGQKRMFFLSNTTDFLANINKYLQSISWYALAAMLVAILNFSFQAVTS